ncbi:uncharacterized protein LOC108451663 [Gossypium arboreum]|uniref:uncharacterized protein LOC108451663 n=1 Tax=Gossypium arboreum TaxID=29729 RepID=UPI0008193A36|nr:uncharacterized protein LOC108451663 [Gossypium arboreum]
MRILSWNCRGVGNPATIRELKQLLVANVPDIVFLCETKIHSKGFSHIRSICKMEDYLAISLEGKVEGWLGRGGKAFTGFYGQTDPSLRQQSWNMLRREWDRNTRYFHVRASGHRKKKSIDRLKDTQGDWHEDKKEIFHIAWNYFNDLFMTSINLDDESDLHDVLECINEDTNRRLNIEFTNEEILMAFKQMDPSKASGIDGLSGSFFKEHWPTVGKDVLSLRHDILKGSKSAECINETSIVLIPKIKNSCEMANFCPISLCRVIYKIVSLTGLKMFSPCVSTKIRAPSFPT